MANVTSNVLLTDEHVGVSSRRRLVCIAFLCASLTMVLLSGRASLVELKSCLGFVREEKVKSVVLGTIATSAVGYGCLRSVHITETFHRTPPPFFYLHPTPLFIL